jgi:predicted branched-subunit amino acid permease
LEFDCNFLSASAVHPYFNAIWKPLPVTIGDRLLRKVVEKLESSMSLPQSASLASSHLEKQAFSEGTRLTVPTFPGIFAWGVVSGMAMLKSGLTITQALGMTFLVFAGSAQMAALPLMVAHAPLLVIFAAAIMVNLRFVIFSFVIGPHFTHLPWWRRMWLGYFSADLMIALFPRRFPAETLPHPQGKVGFFSGIAYPNWLAWQAGALVGIIGASQIPQSWGIGFAGTLALLAVLIPLITNSAAAAGVVVAGLIGIAGYHWPYKLGVLLAVAAGMTAAMIVDTHLKDGE